MVAAHDTVREVHRILRKHMDKNAIWEMLWELHQLSGNKSFRDTIDRLLRFHKDYYAQETTKI